MNKSVQIRKCNKLLNDITSLYDVARHAVVEAYWKIGQRIVQEEQNGEANAVYGEHLLAKLANDLSATLGACRKNRSGFGRLVFLNCLIV